MSENNTGYETSSNTQVAAVEKKKNKKGLIIGIISIAVVLVLLAIVLVYKLYFGNSKRIAIKSIDNFSKKIEDTMDDYLDTTDYGDNYTIKSKIAIDAESQLLNDLATTSTEYVVYNNMVKNLKNLDTELTFAQSKETKKALIQLQSNLKNEELISVKYLIQDNKQYYLVKGLFDTYVDGGEINYFELLEENDLTEEDIEYIYDIAINSLKQNLKDEYFTSENETITINKEKVNTRKITFTINDAVGHELANAILTDLKADKKANKILTDINSDFKNAKVDNDTTIFGENEGIKLITYVNKLTYSNLMYKIEMYDEENATSITYEEKQDKNKDVFNLYDNNEPIGTVEITKKDDELDFNILDSSKNSIGTLKITKNNDIVSTSLSLNIEDVKITLDMTSENKEVVEDKEYTSKATMNLNIESQTTSIATVKLDINSNITEAASINEDISNAVANSTVSESKLQEYMTNIMIRLMS